LASTPLESLEPRRSAQIRLVRSNVVLTIKMSTLMNPKERLEAALRLKPIDRLPVSCPLATATKEIVGLAGCGFPAAFHDPKAMACLAMAASRFAGWESVRVPFDVNIDAEAFGAAMGKDSTECPPGIQGRLVQSYEDLDELAVPDPTLAGRSPVLLKAVEMLANQAGDMPVICAMQGPLTLAAQLRGEEELLLDLLTAPEDAVRLLQKATQWGKRFANAAIDAGADAIIVLDGTSSGDILGPALYRRFSFPFEYEVFKDVKARVPTMLHICGDIGNSLDLILDSGADGLSLGQGMDLGWVKERAMGRMAIVGNVSPTTTLLRGTPEEVRAETIKCILQGADVPAPGCGFAFGTPLANMKAMTHAIRSFHRDIGF